MSDPYQQQPYGSGQQPAPGHQQPQQQHPQQQQPPGPTGPQWGQPWPQQPPQSPGTNGLAIASLVLGILWLYWIGSILAVIFGHVALNQMKRNPYQGGRGLAIAGLVLGYVGIAVLVIFIIVGVIAYVADPNSFN